MTEHNAGQNLTDIAFTSNNGWVLLYEDDLANLAALAAAYENLLR